MKQNMRKDFDQAIIDCNVKDFRLVGLHKYKNILIDIFDRFTTLGKEGLNYYWLWGHLKLPYASVQVKYAPDVITELFDSNEKIWFIAEDWQSSKKQDCFWFYESTLGSAIKVLNEMYGFEYYIISRNMQWMIGENHHDILFAVGEEAINTLTKSNLSSKIKIQSNKME